MEHILKYSITLAALYKLLYENCNMSDTLHYKTNFLILWQAKHHVRKKPQT
jgi:hypothetical protein